ncbi:tetratricopeptide repeat protein [Dictyobacter arantiisoli]|uniref:Uncharacterized protein n=1 Tax=Dictyobacter arantiisoli TaxID=2014874 RepID=A0A5A5TAB7_9CHLR|nr:tetratricopeptide repeat protein [Dictyobacter arantiisoli]GCF08431.1 hypothetical protein KDI_19950 [Dictyobacter arantiisoli]
MSQTQGASHFIGRSAEIETFLGWLADPNGPATLYIHDAAKETERKGGVGKTWLLRRYVELIEELYAKDIVVVMVDFFNIGDRDRVFLAEKIVQGIEELYPSWRATEFRETIRHHRDKQAQNTATSGTLRATTELRESANAALLDDLRRLDIQLEHSDEQKTLLVIFDTFEEIEATPEMAVLRRTQQFPDSYTFKHMRSVVAGRNSLDWMQANWQGRTDEVQVIELAPFNQSEMLEYLEIESIYDLTSDETTARELYERTEGRPIILGLALDILNRRILTIDKLLTIPGDEFERFLVTQVQQIENPINWDILFMAHVYHRFNMSILEWLLNQLNMKQEIRTISQEELITKLPTLTFVRKPNSGADFVLHDEMRRLVNQYCWGMQDSDRRFRKTISSSMIKYFEHKLSQEKNEQKRQEYIIEELYHRLFVDLDDGMNYFIENVREASFVFKMAFSHLLVQEIQKFTAELSPAQYNTLQLRIVKLLRSEDNYAAALELIEKLFQEADALWLESNRSELYREQGVCYIAQSKLKAATDSYLACLELERSLPNNDYQIANIFTSLGRIHQRRGQWATALDYYQKGIELFRKINYRYDYATVLSNISVIYLRQGRIEEALQDCKIAWHLRQQLAQAGEAGEPIVGLSLHTLGQIYLAAGNTVEAERALHAAQDIFVRNNYYIRFAMIYNRFGQVELQKNDLQKALQWFEQGEEAARGVDQEQYINSLNKQGRIYLAWGQQLLEEHEHEQAVVQMKRAQKLFERAITEAALVPDYFQQTESLIDQGITARALGQLEQNTFYLQEAEELATNENYVALLGNIEKERAEIQYQQGQYEQAFQHFSHYCHHMAEYNQNEFINAIQRTIDALLGLPQAAMAAAVQVLLDYWQSQQLEETYPALIKRVTDLRNWMFI